MNNLEEAIKRAREALAIAPHEHLSRAGLLNNLGNKLAN